jgi:hypothetical protein
MNPYEPLFSQQKCGSQRATEQSYSGKEKREYASILENASLCLSFFLSKRGVQRGFKGFKADRKKRQGLMEDG